LKTITKTANVLETVLRNNTGCESMRGTVSVAGNIHSAWLAFFEEQFITGKVMKITNKPLDHDVRF